MSPSKADIREFLRTPIIPSAKGYAQEAEELIRDATPADFSSVLALNAESVRFLSPLTPERLRHIHENAACHNVVHPDWRGLGAVLYDAMIEFAKRTQVSLLTSEFDLDPPNPASSAFHKRYGFCEVGTQWLNGGKKKVSLQTKIIGP